MSCDVERLNQRITECKAWLEASSYQLRSTVLEPPILGMQEDAGKYSWLAEPYGQVIVDSLATLRGALVRARNHPLTETSLFVPIK